MTFASASLGNPVRIFSVSEVNAQVHALLEASFSELWVEGEISNCRAYPSGHTYFTLKDADSQISAVLFRGNAAGLRFKLADGLKVLARARISTYVKRGDLQLIVSVLEPRDKGALQIAFEQLKAKLAGEGLFDAKRKKPLPRFPTRIGIVTSLQGAALRDILTVLKRRWLGLDILLHPVAVQGEAAAGEIAAAIANFNRWYPETEVLLVGRGGGSIEDLWAFNMEAVARAIAASSIPIISCVGHETDVTIADFVADARAPTPSAAAEMAVPDQAPLRESLSYARERLALRINDRLRSLKERLSYLRAHPALKSPSRLYEERLLRVGELAARITEAVQRRMEDSQRALGLQSARLDALSPLKVLGRGYAIAQKLPAREILRAASQARPGDKLLLKLHQGEVECEVQ